MRSFQMDAEATAVAEMIMLIGTASIYTIYIRYARNFLASISIRFDIMSERIWYKDPKRVFLSPDRMLVILPDTSMTLQEQLNSVMRFGIYLGVLTILYDRSVVSATYIIGIIAVVTAVLEYHDSRVDRDIKDRRETLNVQPDRLTGKLCVRPTADNPLMNVLVSDYGLFPTRPAACDVTDASVAKEVRRISRHNVYRDVDDIYGRKAEAELPYYTMPSTTIPNEQTEFANWLYREGSPGVCRDGNMAACGQRIHHHYPGV